MKISQNNLLLSERWESWSLPKYAGQIWDPLSCHVTPSFIFRELRHTSVLYWKQCKLTIDCALHSYARMPLIASFPLSTAQCVASSHLLSIHRYVWVGQWTDILFAARDGPTSNYCLESSSLYWSNYHCESVIQHTGTWEPAWKPAW